ncbi:MAG TPA: sugar phosphate nucleotidyltransferase [Gemmatimonadota bacterium]
MKIVIPAAGQGTRLRPHTHALPKVMLPVAGRPIIGHILADVAPLEPDEVRLIVGYRGDTVESYARRAFPDLPIRIVWQGEQLGLGHAVLQGLDPGDHDAVLVVLGDTVFDVDYREVVAQADHVLGVRPVPDPERFGIVELDGTGGRIAKLVEKPAHPKGNLALVGLYYVHDGQVLRDAIEGLVGEGTRTRGEYQLTDALQRMIEAGERFVPYQIGGWYDCGKPETLLSTNRALLDLRAPEIPAGTAEKSVLIPPIHVAPGCSIENAIVGPHVSVAEGATIRNAIVRDSILAEGAWVEGAVLEGSIIGPEARVHGRARTVNLGDNSEVTW